MLLGDVATVTDNEVGVQDVAATAHNWQQLGEALTIRTASPEGPAEPSANGQPEGSLAVLQAPTPQVTSEHPRSASEGPTASDGITASASLPIVASLLTAAAADTTAEAKSTTTAAAQLPTAEVAADTAKAAVQATTGVPPAVSDASLDLVEEEAGSASEALAAGALQGKGIEAPATAPISKVEPTTRTEGKAAPNSPPVLGVVDADTTTTTAGAQLSTVEVAAGIDKAAAQATAGVRPAVDCASQLAAPGNMDSTTPEPARTAAAQATTSVPPAMTDASLDLEEEKAGCAPEALAAGAPSGKGSESTASANIDEAEPRTNTEGKVASDSPPELSVVDTEHSTHAVEGFNEDKAAADSPGSEVWATIPKQVLATEGTTASASLPTAAAADTTAEANSTTVAEAELPIAEVAAGTDKAAHQAIIGVPHAASVDREEEEAGGAYEALTAGAPSGKGSEATASATISEPEPRTGIEGKAAPDSPSDLSVVDAERATHAAEGFSDDRAAADSPGADVWATTPVAKFTVRATLRDPAAESEGDTIAAKHAAEPAFTMLEDLLGSSSPQAYSKGQAAENKAAAQPASTAAAVATSSQLPRRC